MILVIDGYNLLRHIEPHREITEHERTVFIHELKRYARRKKHRVVLVFDGGPYRWPHKEVINGVKVIYAGARETADTVIMQYLADHKTKDLLLVSSDHELNLCASHYGIASIGAAEFYLLFQEGLKGDVAQPDVEVAFDEDELDLDAVMEQASAVIPQKEEDSMPGKIPHRARKSSKKDRLLLKKLKKL